MKVLPIFFASHSIHTNCWPYGLAYQGGAKHNSLDIRAPLQVSVVLGEQQNRFNTLFVGYEIKVSAPCSDEVIVNFQDSSSTELRPSFGELILSEVFHAHGVSIYGDRSHRVLGWCARGGLEDESIVNKVLQVHLERYLHPGSPHLLHSALWKDFGLLQPAYQMITVIDQPIQNYLVRQESFQGFRAQSSPRSKPPYYQ